MKSSPVELGSTILGLSAGSTLRRLVDRDGVEIAMPREGLVISRHLADQLDVDRGGTVSFEVLEGERVRRQSAIKDGLPEGATLVLEPGRELKEGSRVQVRAQGAK